MDYFSNWYFPNRYFPPEYWGGRPEDIEVIPPTVIYDAPSWASIQVVTEMPTAFKARIIGFSTVAVSLFGNGDGSYNAGGSSVVKAGVSAVQLFGQAILSASGVSAKITGIFDYVTDDNNFWLLAD